MVELTERQDQREAADEPLLLKVEHAVRLTNCSRSFLYEEIAAGRLRAIKLGRSLRIRRADLVAWIEERAAASV